MSKISISILSIVLTFSSASVASETFSEMPPLDQVNYSYGHGPLSPLNSSFTVLVWNIEKASGKIKFQKDFSSLLERADIVMTQESILNNVTWPLLHQFSNWCWSFAISFFWQPDIPTGVMTASRVRPWTWGSIRSSGREPILKSPKMIVWSQFLSTVHHDGILFVNIHALNFVSNEMNYRHVDQALEFIQKFSGPVVFAGDFNTWSPKRLKHLLRGVEQLGLKEATWTDGNAPNPKFDHAFYRGLKLIRADVFDSVKSSDHAPFQLQFAQTP